MATVELTKENFEQVVSESAMVIVDFWAPWCGPCRGFAPIYEQAAEAHADVVFGKINTDQEQELAGAFNIRSIPTLMVFREKVVLFQQAGALPASALEQVIAQAKALDMAKVHQEIAARVLGGLANRAPHLDDRLVELGLELLSQDDVVRLEDLGDVGGELAGLGIDDLVLLFDSDRERWSLHPALPALVSLNARGIDEKLTPALGSPTPRPALPALRHRAGVELPRQPAGPPSFGEGARAPNLGSESPSHDRATRRS